MNHSQSDTPPTRSKRLNVRVFLATQAALLIALPDNHNRMFLLVAYVSVMTVLSDISAMVFLSTKHSEAQGQDHGA